MKSLRPFIILVIAIALLYVYAWPQWNVVAVLRTREVELETALGKAQELTQIRNSLMEKYNAISPEDTKKIARVVPATYDPVKLIADVNAIGLRHGMIIRNTKIANITEVASTGAVQAALPAEPYVKRQLSFSTSGQYRNFISFITELETSLQLMDLQKVEVSASTQGSAQKVGVPQQPSGLLEFKVSLNTYWIQ